MKKHVAGRKFSRDTTSRRAMYRALVRDFFMHDSLTTTSAKAMTILPIIERLIASTKSSSLSQRRSVYSFLGNDRKTTDKIYEFSKKMKTTAGGYLKYVNLPSRKGDNAPLTRIELSQKLENSLVKKGVSGGKKADTTKVDGAKKSNVTLSEPEQSALKKNSESAKKGSISNVLQKLSLKRKARD